MTISKSSILEFSNQIAGPSLPLQLALPYLHCGYKYNILKLELLKHYSETKQGLSRELNPGPRAPEARIIPLDH